VDLEHHVPRRDLAAADGEARLEGLGGDGARTMMLVYNLPSTPAIYQRFAGLSGSACFIGGFGMTALTANDVVVVPIRSGVGFRLGANLGYLKFTRHRPGIRSDAARACRARLVEASARGSQMTIERSARELANLLKSPANCLRLIR
jgi:hypothetical protein